MSKTIKDRFCEALNKILSDCEGDFEYLLNASEMKGALSDIVEDYPDVFTEDLQEKYIEIISAGKKYTCIDELADAIFNDETTNIFDFLTMCVEEESLEFLFDSDKMRIAFSDVEEELRKTHGENIIDNYFKVINSGEKFNSAKEIGEAAVSYETFIAEKIKRAEEEKLAAEKIKRAEEEKLAAEKIKRAEEEKLAVEKIKRAEEEKLAVEKIKRNENYTRSTDYIKTDNEPIYVSKNKSFRYDHSRFEKARIVGARALQIALGAPILVDYPAKMIDPVDIAMLEYDEEVIPISVLRDF